MPRAVDRRASRRLARSALRRPHVRGHARSALDRARHCRSHLAVPPEHCVRDAGRRAALGSRCVRPQGGHGPAAAGGGVGRDRRARDDASTSAFPSGHAATSFAAAVVLALALPALAPAFLVLAAAVSFSRLYVGVHFPLDTVGGADLGLAVATALLLLVRALQRSRPRRTPGLPIGR
ncbi:MAG: phosphatase PAP2 family protein [Gaiellaceae bacterium]